jgi:hypothetical protein
MAACSTAAINRFCGSAEHTGLPYCAGSMVWIIAVSRSALRPHAAPRGTHSRSGHAPRASREPSRPAPSSRPQEDVAPRMISKDVRASRADGSHPSSSTRSGEAARGRARSGRVVPLGAA